MNTALSFLLLLAPLACATTSMTDEERSIQVNLRRAEAITELERIIPSSPKRRLPESYFRLASLEHDHALYLLARGRNERGIAVANRAIDHYDQALVEDPKYERAPEVLLLRGQLNRTIGEPKVAFLVFLSVADNFPDRPEAATAILEIGKLMYQDGRHERAVVAFQGVVDLSRDPAEVAAATKMLERIAIGR